MDKIVVEGGNKLVGEVEVSGAKNAALPILASSLLAEGEHCYRNVPCLADVITLCKLLEKMGASTLSSQRGICQEIGEIDQSNTLKLRISSIAPEAPYELVKTMRASVLVLGPLLARYGKAKVSLPGGCAIGARPIDQHLKGLEKMGAQIDLAQGYVEARAKRLRGITFTFDMITVTGTENLMMAATLAKGQTILENAAREPEVEELARVLQKMGAKISGAGTDQITIDGVDELKPVEHSIIPDRIEAGTFLVAAALTRGEILVKHAIAEHLDAVIGKLREIGAHISCNNRGIFCKGPKNLRPVDIKTMPYPGFPTDMQAQLMVLLTLASGSSVITETVFENRFMHVLELHRMGADIKIDGHTAVVKGVKKLCGAPVMATDLRASASLVLAGLCATGKTEIHRIYHLDRGYDRLEHKLKSLGADIRRTKA